MAWPLIVAAAMAAAQSKPGQRIQSKISNGLFGEDPNEVVAREALAKQEALYDNINLPDLKDINLEKYKYEGDVDPRLAQGGPAVDYNGIDAHTMEATLAGDSEMKGVSTDPRLRDAQMSALMDLQNISSSGGMTAEDKANLSRIQGQTAQADKGRREAILQNAAARGMSGSGNELLAQLQSSQAATDRQSQEGLDIAGMAQARALQAMMQSGQLGGSIRGQDFGEQSAVAQAQDAINKFNVANQNTASQYNATALNQTGQFNAGNQLDTDKFNSAQAYDLNKNNTAIQNQALFANHDGRQGISNANVDIGNKQATANAGKAQQNFQNQLDLANGRTGAAKSAQNYWQDKEKEASQTSQNGIQGAGMVAASYSKSDERSKKNITNVDSLDMDQFLAKLNPKKFEYKDSKDGTGQRTGVMAQDLLKSTLGQEAVVDMGDGHLGYDKDKIIGIQLAALKHLSDKIDKKG